MLALRRDEGDCSSRVAAMEILLGMMLRRGRRERWLLLLLLLLVMRSLENILAAGGGRGGRRDFRLPVRAAVAGVVVLGLFAGGEGVEARHCVCGGGGAWGAERVELVFGSLVVVVAGDSDLGSLLLSFFL